MKTVVRVYFVDENGDRFYGEGPHQLLQAVEKNGSLHAAAQSMGMAYSKAMKLIKHAESALGFRLTDRTAGGASGGGSILTEAGKEWMDRYEAYRNACMEADSKLYLEYFSCQRETAPAADGQPGDR